jgi:1-acyl-sn-glycerol-3-phosphate acyltransferase
MQAPWPDCRCIGRQPVAPAQVCRHAAECATSAPLLNHRKAESRFVEIMKFFLTLYDCAVFYIGVLCFGLMCLLWSTIAAVLYPFMAWAPARRLGRFAIMAVFRIFLGGLKLSGRFRFDLDAVDELKHEKSLIIAANHPSLWDAVLIVSRLPDAACVMKAELISNIFLGGGARLARYIPNAPLRQMIKLAIADLQAGGQVLLFPEGTRTVRQPINTLKGSIGAIACRAGVPVQTLIIESDSPFLTKGWPVYKKPRLPLSYRVRLGRRFEPAGNSSALVTELEQYFMHEVANSQPPTMSHGARRKPALAPANDA